MVRDNRHDSAYLFGAICPARGVGAAIIMPAANTEAMNEHLAEISTQVMPGAHAVLLCDGAGWHQTGDKLRVPDNMRGPVNSPPEAGSNRHSRPVETATPGRKHRAVWRG